MSGAWTIFQREIRTYFLSSIAWVILTLFSLYNGIVFYIIVTFWGTSSGASLVYDCLVQYKRFRAMLRESVSRNPAWVQVLFLRGCRFGG